MSFVGRVRVPVSGALDAIPIHLAVVLDIGKPGHFRILGMTILDQRMHAWRAKPTAERGEFGRAKILIAEHKHRVFCEYTPDPGEGRLVERPELWGTSHERSSDIVA